MTRSRLPRRAARGLAALTDSEMLLRLDGDTLTLLTAGMEQSQTDLSAPERLEFEYMQHLDLLLDALREKKEPLRVFHAGAGACSLPLAWATTRNPARQVAVDTDLKLIELLKEWRVIRPGDPVRLRHGDARALLESSKRTYDVIVRDAFAGDATPAQLASLSWAQLVKSRLNPGGVYLSNVAHGGTQNGKTDVAAAFETFKKALIVTDRKVWKGARLGNLAVATWDLGTAKTQELETELRRLPLPVALYRADEIRGWLGGAKPRP